MPIPSDYKELLRLLNRHRVKYLVVGAYAVVHYTEPRYTKDLDIWIKPEIKNAAKLYKSLKEFGAPLKDITVKNFADKSLIYQIGVEPVRVDIIMDLPGIKFDQSWENRKVAKFEGSRINIIGISELIKSKRKIKRHTDMADIERLKHCQRLRKRRNKE